MRPARSVPGRGRARAGPRGRAIPVLLCWCVIVGTSRASGAAQVPPPSADLVEGGVAVRVALVRDGHERGRLVAWFTPLRSDLHLYSVDLPKQGVRGLGRPTLVELDGSGSIKRDGALTADRPLVALLVKPGVPLPVYPVGPLTLTLPVRLRRPGAATTPVFVTYMACSDRVCLPPVVHRRIAVAMPAR
jgi:hypothetical protein